MRSTRRLDRTAQRCLAAGLLVLCMAIPALGAVWYETYQNAIQAIEQGRCEEAVGLLKDDLIPKMPNAVMKKRAYGMNYIDYLPHFYLGLAYACLGENDKALEALKRAESDGVVLKTDKAEKLRDALRRVQTAPEPVATPTPAVGNGQFNQWVEEAAAAMGDRRCGVAAGLFEKARASNPGEFQKRGLQKDYDDALGCVEEAGHLVTEGQNLLQKGKLVEAKRAFNKADGIHQGRADTARGLDEIARRERDYTTYRAEGDRQFNAGRLEQSYRSYEKARDAAPDRFERDGLDARIKDMDTTLRDQRLTRCRGFFDSGKVRESVTCLDRFLALYPDNATAETLRARARAGLRLGEAGDLEARGSLREARAKYREALDLDPDLEEARNALKRLAAAKGLGEPASTPAAAPPSDLGPAPFSGLGPALHLALAALFDGENERAIQRLEDLAAGAGSRSPDVHAYLGVAYATSAFARSNGEERDRLLEKARRQFNQTLALKSAYSLSERLVSPRIRKLFENARSAQ